MNWDFDWLSNWKVTLNIVLNVIVSALVGSGLVYFVSPPGTPFWSKGIMAAGFVPALSAFVAKMQKSPDQQHADDQTKQIRNGEIPGRRAKDPQQTP